MQVLHKLIITLVILTDSKKKLLKKSKYLYYESDERFLIFWKTSINQTVEINWLLWTGWIYGYDAKLVICKSFKTIDEPCS